MPTSSRTPKSTNKRRNRHVLPSTSCSVLGRIFVVWTTYCVSTTVAHKNNNHFPPAGPWSLPQIPQHQGARGGAANSAKMFLEECEDFFDLLLKFRGGSSDDRGYGGGSGGGGYGRYQDDYGYRGNGDDKNDGHEYYRDGISANRKDSYGGMDGRGDGSYDDYYYDDRGQSPPSKRRRQEDRGEGNSLLSSAPAFIKNGDRTIGLALLGSGTLITFLGITMFFNRALMRLGNLLFVAGIPVTMSLAWVMKILLNREKMRGTICFGLGFFLVLTGNPLLGIFLEFFGFLNLFGNMFPVAFAIAKNMPIIGPILKKITESNKDNNRRRDDDQDRYDDERRRSDDDYYYYGGGDRGGDDGERYY